MTADPHSDRERLNEDLAAYALGALEPAEAEVLELHLDSCDSCRERLRWLYPALDLLPASVEQVSPPETLRESLMAAVRDEAESVADERAPARSKPARAPQKRSRWQGFGEIFMRPALGLAVVVVLIAGAASGYVLRGSDPAATPKNTFVEAKPTRGAPPGASATLERHGDSATLHVNQMPEIDRDQVYEVWVERGGVMEPASTFILGRDGSAEAAVPGPLQGAEGVYVSTEPYPGSARPTSPPVLVAELQ